VLGVLIAVPLLLWLRQRMSRGRASRV
jgi:hypothetical protein